MLLSIIQSISIHPPHHPIMLTSVLPNSVSCLPLSSQCLTAVHQPKLCLTCKHDAHSSVSFPLGDASTHKSLSVHF